MLCDRLTLSRLLGEVCGEKPDRAYTRQEFGERVHSFLETHGCSRRPSATDDHAWVLRLAMIMLELTDRRCLEPPPAPPAGLLEEFEQVLPAAPSETEQFFQARVDPDSSCRRALEVRERVSLDEPVLCLGDDDGTSVALALLGFEEVWAVDIDPRVLDWLRGSGLGLRLAQVDLRSLPDRFYGRFGAVVTDPVRDDYLAGLFLRAAARCSEPDGWLFWADHPDWNRGYPSLLRRARRMGLELVTVREAWHSYRASYYDDSTARHFGLDPDWMRRLAKNVRLWSHLHVLQNRGSARISL